MVETEIAIQKAPKATPVGMPKTVKIVLEDSSDIPPTGLFVGYNGRGYLIRTGEEVDIPLGVKEILDQAIISVPVLGEYNRPVGTKERLRFPYRLV